MLEILSVRLKLKVNHQEHTCEVKPNGFLSHQYANMVVIPTIHILLKYLNTVVPLFLSSFVSEVHLPEKKNEILGL